MFQPRNVINRAIFKNELQRYLFGISPLRDSFEKHPHGTIVTTLIDQDLLHVHGFVLPDASEFVFNHDPENVVVWNTQAARPNRQPVHVLGNYPASQARAIFMVRDKRKKKFGSHERAVHAVDYVKVFEPIENRHYVIKGAIPFSDLSATLRYAL